MTAPVASDLLITPAVPYTADDLVASYTYFDADADPESGSEIRWYKNNVLQVVYNDILTVPAAAVIRGDTWYFTVRPRDDTGEWGDTKTSSSVTVENSAPVASNLSVTPASPYTDDDLVAGYDYYDADGNPESGSEIRWYKNGSLESAFNDLKTIPASATTKGEQWYFTVKPRDGLDFGTLQTSPTVTINNSLPTATSVILSPTTPYTVDNLVATYTYSDADGDSESGTEIKWYKNDVLQSSYNNLTTVLSDDISRGEEWYFTVKPKDGSDFGVLKTSNKVVVQNTAPVAIEPTLGTFMAGQDLVSSYTYFDADTDPESGTEIRWYKNTVLQSAYNDLATVPASATTAGDQWYFTVKPKDGLIFGELQTSNTATILSATINTNTNALTVGAEGGSKFFKGLIDEIRVSNISRSITVPSDLTFNTVTLVPTLQTESDLEVGDKIKASYVLVDNNYTESIYFSDNGTQASVSRFARVDNVTTDQTGAQTGGAIADISISLFSEPVEGKDYLVSYKYKAPIEGETITIDYLYNGAVADVTQEITKTKPVTADVLVKQGKEVKVDVTVHVYVVDDPQYDLKQIKTTVIDTIKSKLTANSLGGSIEDADIIDVIMGVAGVTDVEISELKKIGQTLVNDIKLAKSEYSAPGVVSVTTSFK